MFAGALQETFKVRAKEQGKVKKLVKGLASVEGGVVGCVGKGPSGRGSSKHKGLGAENTVLPTGHRPVCWEHGDQKSCYNKLKPKGCSAGGLYITFYISVFKIYVIYDVRFGLVGGGFIWPLFLIK